MTTHPEICRAYDSAIRRLVEHGVTLKSGRTFMLSIEGKTVSRFDTVDGLTAFADALDFAKEQAAPPVADELETLCAEAYQVIGHLASDAGRFDDPGVQKVLDNLSRLRLVHDDVLPFGSACPAPDTLPAP